MRTEKHCGGCERTLPLAEFGKDMRNSDGLHTRCKLCVNAYQNERNKRLQANRDRMREAARAQEPRPTLPAQGGFGSWFLNQLTQQGGLTAQAMEVLQPSKASTGQPSASAQMDSPSPQPKLNLSKVTWAPADTDEDGWFTP